MKLNLASLITTVAAFAATATADRMIIHEYCLTLVCNDPATFITAYGEYNVDARDGCRDTDVPGMNNLCVDHAHGRAHFNFDGQPKRCMVEVDNDFATCSDDYQWATCSTIYYDEVPCTW